MMQTRIIAIVTLSLLVSCHADDSDNAADAAAVDAEAIDATRPQRDSGQSPPIDVCVGFDGFDAAATPTTGPGGPCVEGMQCIGAPLLCVDFAPCMCVGGAWQCADAGPIPPLPTRDPKNCEWCNKDSLVEVDFACTLPDVCGGLCACFKGQWICKAVPGGGGDAGADCPVSPCSVDPPTFGASDGGCFSPDCSTIGACDCHER